MFGNLDKKFEEFRELKNRIDRVCEYIEDNLIDQQKPVLFREEQLRVVISILKGESH